MINKPRKHHFIPVFYLKRWAGEDGRVCQFSRPWHREVKPKRVHPEATGYVDRLYELRGLDPSRRQLVEERFMQPVDARAADALATLYAPVQATWSLERRSAWTLFMLSLLLRTPEDLALFKSAYVNSFTTVLPGMEEEYARNRQPGDPPTVQEFLAAVSQEAREDLALRTLPRLIDNAEVIIFINKMKWFTIETRAATYDLLTSDRPIVLTNGLNKKGSYIVMPIGPRRLFVAVNDAEMLKALTANSSELVGDVNNTVVSHAVRFVYGRDDRKLRFVQNRMSSVRSPSLIRLMRAPH